MTGGRIVRLVARVALRTLASIVAVVAVVVAGVLLHLDTPVVRRVVVARVNQLVFQPLFRGSFVIVSLAHVDPFGVSGARVRISDPDGRPVILADGVDGRFGTAALLESVLVHPRDLVIVVPEVSISHADVRLDMDERGVAIARSFFPRKVSTEPPRPADGHGVHVFIPRIHIRHAWVHGAMPRVPYLDGDVTELDAAFAFEPGHLSADARKGHVVARGIALGADARGAFHGRYAMTLGQAPEMGGRVAWDGEVGALRETGALEIGNGRFDASLDAREASADAIRSLWPASPITGSGVAHVEAHGPLDAIELVVHVGLDAATADLHGEVGFGAGRRAEVSFDVAGVDVHQFAPTVPPTRLGLTGDVHAHVTAEGDVDGLASLDFGGGPVAGLPLPRTTLRTNGFRAKTGAFGGDATIVIHEAGAPTTISLHAVPRGRSSRVEFSVVSDAVRLHALRHLSVDATGSARVLGKGNVDLEELAVDAAVDTRGETFERGPLHVSTASVVAQAHGKLTDPRVDVELHAQGVQWAETAFATVDASVHGRGLAPHVTVHERSAAVPDLDAAFDVDLMDGPTLRNIDATVAHAGASARVRADRVRFAGGDVAVDAVVVDGLGETTTGSFDRKGTVLRFAAHAPRLDLERLAKLAALEETLRGTLVLDADVSVDRYRATGQARARLAGGRIGTVEGITASFDGHLLGRKFVGAARAQAADLGTLEIDAKELSIGGTGALTRAAWQKAFGDVTLKGQIDLAALLHHVPVANLPIADVHGTVDIEGRLERDSTNDFTPLVELSVTTSGLSVSGPPRAGASPDAEGPPSPPSWTVEGIDTTTTARINGDTGFVDVSSHLRDAHGDLAVLQATSAGIPYSALYAAPASARALLPTIPFDAHLVLPARDLTTLPPSLSRSPVDGTLEGDVTLKGPLSSAETKVALHLRKLTSGVVRLTTPVDVDVRGTYDGAHGEVEVEAIRESKKVFSAVVHGDLRATDLAARGAAAAWEASAKAHLDRLPLVTIGALDDRQFRGHLSGDLEVQHLHTDATAHASLALADLQIGDASFPDARATLDADGKSVKAEARLDEADGFGEVKSSVAATWGAALLPVPDPHQTLEVAVEARRFRAAVLLPFVQGSVDQLDGLLDADAHASVDPRTRNVRVQGKVALRDGLFELSEFGGELHDVAGTLTVTPDGLLTLENAKASGVSGEILASASARLDGLHLLAARATARIPKSRPLPLSVRGSLLGSVDGRLDVTEVLSADRRTLDFKVDVPSLHLQLPEKGAQDVQELGKLSGVTLGRRVGPGRTFVAEPTVDDDGEVTHVRPADARQIRVETHFGDDVWIRRGGDLRLDLTGGPVVTVADKARVTGRIGLHGGSLSLYGKTFAIETGTVTFVGDDPSNPQVNVTAGWGAPDGSQIKADFIGPLKTGKVTLRSEPPLGQNDIVQLLLFGTTEGQAAAAQGSAPGTSSAEGVAGSFATQPLNRALDQFGLSTVSTKVDTTSMNAKPEVIVQIAKDLSVQLAHIIGVPPPGSSPDVNLLTINWRFLRKWTMEATVGDAGSTIVDLVWQYRY